MNNPSEPRFPRSHVFFVLAVLFCGCSRSGETITLRFVNEAGKPVAGVQARVYGDDGPESILLKSNRKGTCTLDFSRIKTRNKSFQTYIWHPDYVYLRCSFGSWGIEPTPEEFTFHLERGREIGGVIVDEKGKPVKGATVRMRYKDGEPDSDQWPHPAPLYQEPVTDDEGRWAVTQIPTAKFQPLCLYVPTVAGFAPQQVFFEQEDESFQSLLDKSHQTVLSPGLKLVGKLIAEDGENLDRTVLKVGGPFHSIYSPGIDVSKTGDFQMNGLAAGEYTFKIIPENHAPTVFQATLAADSAPIEIPLQHGKPIRFRVTDTEGKPISGIEMRCFHAIPLTSIDSFFTDMERVVKATDAEGRTVWNNALDEPCGYAFIHKDYLISFIYDLTPKEEEHPITMCRKLTVRGTVVDAETKKAVPMFWGIISGWMEPQEGDEDPTGWNFSVGAVFPPVKGDISYIIEPSFFVERCRVEIGAEGYEPAISEEFSLKDGDREFHFELKKVEKMEP